MSKVDVKELACLYGLDGFIPANGDWLEFVDYLNQYTRHVLEQAAKECLGVAKETLSAKVTEGASECYRRVLEMKP